MEILLMIGGAALLAYAFSNKSAADAPAFAFDDLFPDDDSLDWLQPVTVTPEVSLMTGTASAAPISDPSQYSDAELLARTIYGESRGQPYAGQQAVGSVILNRVAATGKSLSDVVLARLQFSAWNANDPNRAKMLNVSDAALAPYLDLANGLLDGSITDNTNGATHYYNPSVVTPRWADEYPVLAKIGNHLFLGS